MYKKEEFKNLSTKNSRIIQSKNEQYKLNQELLKQLEILDSENYQLKEALADLEKDLKEKDQSIEESQKIISKLKEEYTKVIKELQQMEKSYNELLGEMNKKSIEIKHAKKHQSLLNVLKTKNDSLSNEKNNLYKENIIMRKKILSCGNISVKIGNDIKNKDLIIENLQTKNNNMINIMKERENIIEKQGKKIKELNNIINSKNEELKIMMNISKEINKENKINVKEITKQAVKTIKAFQNNNNKIRNHSFDFDCNSKINISEYKTSFDDFELIFKNKKAIFFLEEAINEILYIPNNLKKISKEFLINMNLKTELIKNELYSGLIREAQFIKFLQNTFDQLFKDNKGVLNIFQNFLQFKTKYLNLIKENYSIKKILGSLYNKDGSYLQKIKEKIKKNNNLIKNRFIEKEKEIQNLKNEIKSLNNILTTNSIYNNNSINTITHLSSNTFKKREKLLGELISPKNWNTLPTLESTGTNYSNFDYTSPEKNNKEPIIKTKRINKKICQRKNIKKMPIQNIYNINGNEIFNYNNSLEINNPIKTEANTSKESKQFIFFNDYNSSKTEIKSKYNYKKDISSLQKEINRILRKSITNNDIINSPINISNSKNNTSKKTPKFIKINNHMNKQKKGCHIFSDRIHKKVNSISILDIKNNINPYSQILKTEEKDILKNNNKNINKASIENNTIKKFKKYSIFNYDFFINLFFKINNNIFDVFELNKYRQIYNLTNMDNIYLNFKQICNELKNKTDEINLKINKSHYGMESNLIEKKNLQSENKYFIDKSFNFFNERIISLKKFEYEFINMNDYIKNYLISQETTIKIMYNTGKKYFKFEPIEKLFNLFEDCLCYRINEMNENIIFSRKLLIKLFKNQINCLFLSFEYNFN